MTDERLSPSGQKYRGTPAFVVRDSLTTLTAHDVADFPNGCQAWVISEGCVYQLDTTSSFAPHPTLIINRNTVSTVQNGSVSAKPFVGQWFRRSKAYVVSNFVLWSAGGTKVIGFGPGQLLLTGANTVTPDIVLDLSAVVPAGHSLLNVTPDTGGNIWTCAYRVSGAVTTSIFRVPLLKTLSSGAPTPDVILTNATGVGTTSGWEVLFDKANQMWFVDNTSSDNPGKLSKFAQYQYAVSGAPTALSSIQILHNLLSTPQNCCFDAYGNMWCAGFGGGGGTPSIAQVSAAQLAVPGTSLGVVPPVVWSGSNFVGPDACAFASTGLLWVSDYGTGGATSKLNAFDPTQATGNPAPVVSITCADFFGLGGLAFDAAGNAWLCNADNGKFVQIAAADLAASGLKVSKSVLTQALPVFPGGLSFPQNVQRSGLVSSGAPQPI